MGLSAKMAKLKQILQLRNRGATHYPLEETMEKNKIFWLAGLAMVWAMVFYSENRPKAFPPSQLDLSTRFPGGQIYVEENPVLTNYVSVSEERILGLKSTKVYLSLRNRLNNPTFFYLVVDTSTVPLRLCQGSFYIEGRHYRLKKWTLEGRVLELEWARERWTTYLVFTTVVVFMVVILVFSV